MTDVETLIDGLITLIKSKLSTKLAEIDAEKNDGVTLATIDNAAYSDFGIPDNILNYDPFIWVVENAISGDSIGAHTAMEIEIFAAVVIADSGNDLSMGKRVRRYARAMKEVIEENFKLQGTLEVKSMSPESYKLRDEKFHHFAGVSINVSIT